MSADEIQNHLDEIKDFKEEPCPWDDIKIPKGYTVNEEGVKYTMDDGDHEIITFKPVWVAALSRDTQSDNWGRLVYWIDHDDKQHERAIPSSLFHAQGTELAQQLALGGLPVVPGKERKLLQYLTAFTVKKRLTAATSTGWHEKAFVLPDTTIGETTGESIVFQPNGLSDISKAINIKGSLDTWQKQMTEVSPLVKFAVCASLSAPIRYLAGIESGGFNFYGTTSHGKTTMLQAAASVWGNGVDPQYAGGASAYVQRWNSTANALEAKAESFNDLPLIVDEIGEGESNSFGQTIYRIMSGTGRSRSKRDGALADSKSWRVLILSAGELPVSDYVAESGKKVRGGQLIRLVDIPVGTAFDSAKEADAIKALSSEHYGHAGRELIRSGDLLEGWLDIDLDSLGHALTNEAGRVRKRFALARHAGALAARRGIAPWSENQVYEACKQAYTSWLKTSSCASEAERGVENVRNYILKHGSSRFELEGIVLQRDRSGWHRDDTYHFIPDSFKEACGGVSPDTVKRHLKDNGHLHISAHNRLTAQIRVDGAVIRVVSVKQSLLEMTGYSPDVSRDTAVTTSEVRPVTPVTGKDSVTTVTTSNEQPVTPETRTTQGVQPPSPVSPTKNDNTDLNEEKVLRI